MTITNINSVDSFHQQRVSIYESTKEQIANNYFTYAKITETLEVFTKEVREAGHLYQNGKVQPLPSQEILDEEQEKILNKYEDFKDSFEKLKTIVENIKTTIGFLKPVQRRDSEELLLQENSPELYDRIKSHEWTCLNYARELNPSYDSFLALQKRMGLQLHDTNSELEWSLQRVCQIFSNKGMPLSLFSRSYNFVTYPVVPKSKRAQSGASVSTEAEVEEGIANLLLETQKDEQLNGTNPVADPELNQQIQDGDLKKNEEMFPALPTSTPGQNLFSKPRIVNGPGRLGVPNSRPSRFQDRSKNEVKTEVNRPNEKKNIQEPNSNKTNAQG